MTVGVALIGAGIWAREEHLPAIQASNHLELKAVYSRSLKSTETIAAGIPGIDVFSDDSDNGLEALLKRTDISAVIVSLPIKNQRQYIEAALKAGKHVLSEKPVAENLDEAREMIKWYRSHISGPTWCVAENWRFLDSFEAARDEIKKLGKIIGFQVRSFATIEQGWKFFETEWRKNPTHQGGFLLDGGVHYTAGLRRLLSAQSDCQITSLSAFSNQIKDYLPPVDTINAVMKTTTGVTGAFQISSGTTLRGNEWTIACEGGVVSVNDAEIKCLVDGKETIKTAPNERTGVPPEVRAWGNALVTGEVLAAQSPEAALGDLELLELMLRSGEQGGAPMVCSHQHE